METKTLFYSFTSKPINMCTKYASKNIRKCINRQLLFDEGAVRVIFLFLVEPLIC